MAKRARVESRFAPHPRPRGALPELEESGSSRGVIGTGQRPLPASERAVPSAPSGGVRCGSRPPGSNRFTAPLLRVKSYSINSIISYILIHEAATCELRGAMSSGPALGLGHAFVVDDSP